MLELLSHCGPVYPAARAFYLLLQLHHAVGSFFDSVDPDLDLDLVADLVADPIAHLAVDLAAHRYVCPIAHLAIDLVSDLSMDLDSYFAAPVSHLSIWSQTWIWTRPLTRFILLLSFIIAFEVK